MKKIYCYIILGIIFLFSTTCRAQRKAEKYNRINGLYNDTELYIVDTISIQDPVIIVFKETEGQNKSKKHIRHVLVSKRALDSVPNNSSINCQEFLSSQGGYLFFHARDINALIASLAYISPTHISWPRYSELVDSLRYSRKDSIWVKIDENNYKSQKYKGWECYDIYPRKFLLCLVKGSLLYKYDSIDNVIHFKNMDNVYFRVLAPITW